MSTLIEWTDETWNPITGCDRISPGCKHCYAKRLHDMRHKAHLNGKKMPLQYHETFEHVHCWPDRLETPLHWRAPRLIFVNSGADVFHEDVPTEFIDRIFAEMADCGWHTFQMLTKRPERMFGYYIASPRQASPAYRINGLIKRGLVWPLPNVWPGVSVESKKYLYRLDLLRQVPAAVRMVSFEPLLEDLGTVNLEGIGWAIVGGESGPGARPMHPDWARSLRDQCLAQGVPFFFKQWGEWVPLEGRPELAEKFLRDRNCTRIPGGSVTELPFSPLSPGGALIGRVGKKKAGRQLDGREWNEFPKPYPGHEVVRLKRRIAA